MLVLGRYIRLYAVARITDFANLGDVLRDVIEENTELSQAKANRALRAAVIKTWGDIIVETPVGQVRGGRARGNWFVTFGQPSQTVSDAVDSSKGPSHVASQTNTSMFGEKWFLTNNLPYIRTLEFGGYGTGSANEEGSKVTPQGFSKQAPAGMVRKNLAKFPRNLRRAFESQR